MKPTTMSGYSTNERQAGVLILRFLDELNQRAGGTDENLLVASECIAKALNIDAEKDAASLNLEGVKLLEALQLPEATATTAPTQAAIPRLAALKNSLKFQKYLEKVTEMGVFKGTEEGKLRCDAARCRHQGGHLPCLRDCFCSLPRHRL